MLTFLISKVEKSIRSNMESPFNLFLAKRSPFGSANLFSFRFSPYVIPLSIATHLGIINTILFLFTPATYLDPTSIIYYNFSWLFIAFSLKYYRFSKNEKFETNLPKFLYLYILFVLAYFAYFSFRGIEFSIQHQAIILITIFDVVTFHRAVFYYFRKIYRTKAGNFVNVVVVGVDKNLKKLRRFFAQPELGYRYNGYFHNQDTGQGNYLGKVDDCYDYIQENSVDEIYCVASRLSEGELRTLLTFADNNFKKLKIIPDNKGIITRTMDVELLDTTPVLNLRELKLNTEYGKIGKRVFDIVFSSLVILFVLSWLTPLMYVIIKLDSKGPLFFKQLRNGQMKQPFYCLKFRSMEVNGQADKKMGTKNDPRITRVGKFLRETNLDELPQFFNVFMGDMTVVGPRPHMELHTQEYEKSVNKYLIRHFSKPGITGLAQIKSYRGEIKNKYDIIHRVKLDIFYLENVSFCLDLKIILLTVVKTIIGDKKAY